jgi:hypothetical protein
MLDPSTPGATGGGVLQVAADVHPGGGAGGGSTLTAVTGGGGGGVVLLVARESVTLGCVVVPLLGEVCGEVDVSGGGGDGYGAGGGAGGTVHIEAPVVQLYGTLRAVGGGGACGGGAGSGEDGRDGGRGCSGLSPDGGGGNGGLADNRPWSGAGGTGLDVFCASGGAAGGGGGAAGRLGLRAAPGAVLIDVAADLRVAGCGGSIVGCQQPLVVY